LAQKNVWTDGLHRVDALNPVKQDRALLNDLFVRWFENGGAAASDPPAILRPDALLVNALQGCIRRLTTQTPLVLVMDTCEVIAGDLEQWMRQLVAPLCDGGTPFLALIGSRFPPDAAEPAGSRHLWRAAMEEERWRSVAFDEGVRFTVQEIVVGLTRVKPTLDDTEHLAEQLHRITLGVPLALRSLIDLHEEGSDVLTKLDGLEPDYDDKSAYEDAEKRVVEKVADRFLLHLSNRSDRQSDFRDIIALALLHEVNREVLKRLWETDNVTGRLRELAKRYSLLAVGDLHATVHSFLRRRWRSEDRPSLVDAVIAQLSAAAETIELDGLPGEIPYMDVLAVWLNASGWREGAMALKRFAPVIALALAFDEHAHLVIDLAAEIKATGERADIQQALRKLADQYRLGSITVSPWGSDEVITWLEEEEQQGTWSSVEKAALDLLRGLKRVSLGARKEALEPLLSALQVFGDRHPPPRGRLFGEALFDIGYAFMDARERRGEAISAFRGALRLGHAEAPSTNNIGTILAKMGRSKEAEEMFRKAMQLNARRALYPRNLGDLLRDGKRWEAARQAYERSLAIDGEYADAVNSLALLHKAQSETEQAEELVDSNGGRPPFSNRGWRRMRGLLRLR
jgi:tetratricopeptide (TPR) repeat protein